MCGVCVRAVSPPGLSSLSLAVGLCERAFVCAPPLGSSEIATYGRNVLHRSLQRRAVTLVEQPQDHAVGPTEPHLRRVLAAAATLARPRGVVLFVHVARGSPSHQV